MIVVGIDPGKDGGIAVINNTDIIHTTKLPEGYERIQVIKDIIYKCTGERIVFVIEKVGAMPGQGVTSMFTFGYGYGHLMAILETLQQRIEVIMPAKWKKHFGIPGKKSDIAESKKATITAVGRRYPKSTNLKYHSGIFDAILLARYYIENYKETSND